MPTSSETQKVSAASLPLPGGAATESTLSSVAASLTSIDGKTPASGALTDAQLRASAVPVSVSALPLPTGGATAAAQTDGSQRAKITDGTNNAVLLNRGPIGTEYGLAVRQVGLPTTPFGSVATASPTPRVQIDAVEGLLDTDVETFTDGASGSATVSGNLFTVTTGTTVGGYGTVRSRRLCRYRAGQGLDFRFTALFSTPAANSLQLAGAFNAGDGLFFGYSGTTFGVMRRLAGAVGIYRLTLSAAPTGAETATITLNGTAFTVTLANTTIAVAAETIANRVGGYTGYLSPTANGATVTWLQTVPAVAAGAFTFSSTGTAAGTFSTVQAGAANDAATGFVAQSAWNIDPMDGTGPSGMTLDPTKLNVYGFQLGYLGASPILARIITDRGWQDVHQISYPNLNTTTTLKIPTLRIGWAAASLGSSTNLTVAGASAAGFVYGDLSDLRDPTACKASATATTTETAILSLRVRREFNGRVNSREVMPMHLNAAVETANRLVAINIYINPTVVGTQAWSYLDQARSALEVSTSAVTLTASTGRLVTSGSAPTGTPLLLELDQLLIRCEPGDVIVIAIQAASNTAVTNVALSLEEE